MRYNVVIRASVVREPSQHLAGDTTTRRESLVSSHHLNRPGSADHSKCSTLISVTRRLTFSAAHALRRDDWDAERNRDTYGTCVNDHGHNYELEVTVRGDPSVDTGMIINLRELDRIVRETIIDKVDHRHLNKDVDFLTGVIPTVENLALVFWERLQHSIGGLHKVRLTETTSSSAEVIGP